MNRAYYNEHDPFAAEWLKILIVSGLIAEGDVDSRSIEDVKPNDLAGYTQCHFFAGIGGWSHALRLAGWPDSRPVWTGSCPCQPFSAAGKGIGFADERHLWPAFDWLIANCRPVTIFGEQVASPAGLAWFDTVYTDLENTGYTLGASDLCAAGIGAPHIRQRLYFRADSLDTGLQRLTGHERNWNKPGWLSESETRSIAKTGATRGFWADYDWWHGRDEKFRPIEPGVFPLAHGVSARVGRLRGYGNAIVPQVAAEFIKASEGV